MSAGASEEQEEQFVETLKKVAVQLKAAGIPFALAGGYALYAHGGPGSGHDVDFMVKKETVDSAKEALSSAGLKIVEPVEDWLIKVYDEDRLVDLIFAVAGRPVDDEMLSHVTELELHSVQMPVLDVTDVMSSKLRVMTPHYCDFAPLIAQTRSVREQIDWQRLLSDTAESPFARAFIYLLQELDIAPRDLGDC